MSNTPAVFYFNFINGDQKRTFGFTITAQGAERIRQQAFCQTFDDFAFVTLQDKYLPKFILDCQHEWDSNPDDRVYGMAYMTKDPMCYSEIVVLMKKWRDLFINLSGGPERVSSITEITLPEIVKDYDAYELITEKLGGEVSKEIMFNKIENKEILTLKDIIVGSVVKLNDHLFTTGLTDKEVDALMAGGATAIGGGFGAITKDASDEAMSELKDHLKGQRALDVLEIDKPGKMIGKGKKKKQAPVEIKSTSLMDILSGKYAYDPEKNENIYVAKPGDVLIIKKIPKNPEHIEVEFKKDKKKFGTVRSDLLLHNITIIKKDTQ